MLSQPSQHPESIEVAGCFAEPVLSEVEGFNMTEKGLVDVGSKDHTVKNVPASAIPPLGNFRKLLLALGAFGC